MSCFFQWKLASDSALLPGISQPETSSPDWPSVFSIVPNTFVTMLIHFTPLNRKFPYRCYGAHRCTNQWETKVCTPTFRDTVHELMGHMALFADPDFAQFSQEIGLASLGTSEEDLKKLATLYFFSIEFGLCCVGYEHKTNKPRYKIYGAGLLSSAGELQHAIAGKTEIIRFDPDRVVQQECLITTFQDAYFYTRNFDEAQQKLR